MERNSVSVYDQEINLIDLIFEILHHWRILILTAAIGAILAGGMNGVFSYRSRGDAEAIRDAVAQNEASVEMYQKNRKSREDTIESLKKAMNHQNEYMERSTLMSMSAYDLGVAKAEVLIKAEEVAVHPDAQRKTDVGNVGIIYKTLLTDTSFLDGIAAKTGMETQYLRELIRIEVASLMNKEIISEKESEQIIVYPVKPHIGKDDSMILSVSVRCSETEMAANVLHDILEQLSSVKSLVEEKVGPHTFAVLKEDIGRVIDMELAEQQQREWDRAVELRKAMDDETAALKKMAGPASVSINNGIAPKTLIKFAALGGMMGILLPAFWFSMLFVMSDKVYSVKNLTDRYAVKLLGRLPKKDRKSSAIDQLLDRMEKKVNVCSSEVEYELIAANIRNYAGDAKRILVTGSGSVTDVTEVAAKMSEKLLDYQIISEGSLLRDVPALKQLPQCDAVVLVESCKVSSHSEVKAEFEKITDLDKRVIGWVVFE